MRIRSIALANVRRFTSPVRIDGFAEGLNLLCAPNEHGKSTLFDAVQALFFTPHGSSAKEIKALRPHAGGAPEVAVEVETAEGRFLIRKRWLGRAEAAVLRDGRLIAQAGEAEAWISGLLGGGDGGPSGLLWVRQGVTGLSDGPKAQQEAALAARRDLLSSVTGEVESMTGGRRMDEALARCRAELAQYATPSGRVLGKGPWKAAQDRLAELGDRRDLLAARAEALHDALERRKRQRRDLAELASPEAVAERTARLDEATQAFRAAERHAEELETAARDLEFARLAVASAQARLDRLGAAAEEGEAAAQAAREGEARAAAARAAQEQAGAALREAAAAMETAREAARQAEAARREAQRQAAAREGAARRADLRDRIARAEAARAAMELAAAEAGQGPDARAVRRLDDLAHALATARSLRDGAAAQVVMAYAPGRAGTVRIGDMALPEAVAVAIPEGAALAIEGIGTLTVRPGAQGRDDGAVAAAEAALRHALDALGAATPDAARQAAEARAAAERRQGEAKAELAAIAPGGIDALRAALAAIPAPDDAAAEAPDPVAAEAALAAAEAALAEATARRDAAAARASDARSRAATAQAEAAAAAERLARAEAALGRLDTRDAGAIAAERDRAATAATAAAALHARKRAEAPDLAAAAAALRRATSVSEGAVEAIARLRTEIATLDERIGQSAGEAVEEELAATREEHAAAEARLAAIEREVKVLRRLESALEAARTEARERYFEPVAAELRPLLQLMWPDAELTWGDQTLLPDALIRDGATEPLGILSGGTQEQIALMVRLAFARMLARDGRHAPVILDDALVFTDDDRIERMFDALHRQAGDLQIIVLSCRQRAFRNLGGQVLHIAPAASAESGT